MDELPAIFRIPGQLEQRFGDGLERMLESHDGLGVFILVLANALYDESIHRRLDTALVQRFVQAADALRETLRAGRQPGDAADDVDVFLRLMAVGLGEMPLTRFRNAGRFQLQFNLLRALRPPRMAGARVKQVFQPFDEQGFHFNRPFLLKEVLWTGRLLGRECRLLYNKFPFAHLHALLVIEPEANRPQYLAEADHRLVWDLCSQGGRVLPGLGFGYNSYGAYASVNHQHFQMFHHRGAGYPVESPCWRHNGGGEAYPLECMRLTASEAAWTAVAGLQQHNQPFNLLYRPGCAYLLPRRFQGDYRQAPWTSGFAWSELAGSVTTFNSEDFQQLDEQAIASEMAQLSPQPL